VEWPAKGTFDLLTTYQVEQVVMGQSSHPNQIPHILASVEVLSENPSWLQVHKKRHKLLKVSPFH
jgi:hypothetical protein